MEKKNLPLRTLHMEAARVDFGLEPVKKEKAPPAPKKSKLPLVVGAAALVVVAFAAGRSFGQSETTTPNSGAAVSSAVQKTEKDDQMAKQMPDTDANSSDALQKTEAENLPLLRSDFDDEGLFEEETPAVLWGNEVYSREQIKTVTFLDSTAEANDTAWDLSAEGDDSVLAWVEPNGDLYDLYVAGEGGVAGNESLRYLLADFEELKKVDFNGCLDISSVSDMVFMFSGCGNLTEVDVSGWDTSNVTDMELMFDGCSSLAELDVSDWNTSSVTDMVFMFYGCGSLAELDVSRWDTSSVTSMRSMFDGCGSLAELDVSGWDTSSVTSMWDMFNECSSLMKLDVSSWDTSSVTDMYSMFYQCSSLTELDVSGWDTSNVTDMRWMFSGCSGLTELDVSGWNTSNVTEMGSMFNNTQWEDDPPIQ